MIILMLFIATETAAAFSAVDFQTVEACDRAGRLAVETFTQRNTAWYRGARVSYVCVRRD